MENHDAPQLDLQHRLLQAAVFAAFDDDEESLGIGGR